MRKKQTRVFKFGAFWKVQVKNGPIWETRRCLHLTRREAREAAKTAAIN